MLPVVDLADPGYAREADDRVIAAMCRTQACAVVVRQDTAWTIIGSPRGVEFPVVFVGYTPGHYTALDLTEGDRTAATAAVLRWPSRSDYSVFRLSAVPTPGDNQMCFWYAASRGLARWRNRPLHTAAEWTEAALALKTAVHAAIQAEQRVLLQS